MRLKKIIFYAAGILLFGVAIGHLPPVNLNTADAKQLASLKGIGEKKAIAIIANRKKHGDFHSLNDLTRIKGIGKTFLQRLIKKNSGQLILKKP